MSVTSASKSEVYSVPSSTETGSCTPNPMRFSTLHAPIFRFCGLVFGSLPDFFYRTAKISSPLSPVPDPTAPSLSTMMDRTPGSGDRRRSCPPPAVPCALLGAGEALPDTVTSARNPSDFGGRIHGLIGVLDASNHAPFPPHRIVLLNLSFLSSTLLLSCLFPSADSVPFVFTS